jgi:uncharacterized protein DUF4038
MVKSPSGWRFGKPDQLRLSENRRFLVRGDGTPFYWFGDTAWELFHRANREEAEHYLKKRADQGFTVVQAVVLAEFQGIREPNGDLPLIGEDPTRPEEAYFRHVEWIVSRRLADSARSGSVDQSSISDANSGYSLIVPAKGAVPGAGTKFINATRSADGDYAMIYSAASSPIRSTPVCFPGNRSIFGGSIRAWEAISIWEFSRDPT